MRICSGKPILSKVDNYASKTSFYAIALKTNSTTRKKKQKPIAAHPLPPAYNRPHTHPQQIIRSHYSLRNRIRFRFRVRPRIRIRVSVRIRIITKGHRRQRITKAIRLYAHRLGDILNLDPPQDDILRN